MRGGLTAMAVGEWLGVGTNPGQRAPTLLGALGLTEHRSYRLGLGTPRYLVSARRRRIIDLREGSG